MLPGNGQLDPVDPALRTDGARLGAVTIERLEVEPDEDEVLRYLGYPKEARPDPRVRDRVREVLAEAWPHVRPRGAYSVYDVEVLDRRSLTLRGGARFTGIIGDYLGPAQRTAVFVATAGSEISELATEAMRSGDALGGLVLGAVGSMAAEGATDALIEDLRGRIGPGEALTLRYSPGYCGLSLHQQRTIFDLVDAAQVGVELLPSMIMRPLKSVSGLVGIGPADAVSARGSPCDRCPLTDCKMRR
ncbi:MAG: hypothetical protein HY721_19185 [Planctomycetes bacterium]|nr:hypothetical protein [Planctomycetota bacterium]